MSHWCYDSTKLHKLKIIKSNQINSIIITKGFQTFLSPLKILKIKWFVFVTITPLKYLHKEQSYHRVTCESGSGQPVTVHSVDS